MRNVLAIGAHPDDVELGCGATLLAHAAAGDTVTVLVLTGGEAGPGTANRFDEQRAAAHSLGASLRWGGLTDCTLTPDAATVRLIEGVIEETQADLVYVHAADDSHQDHRAAAAAARSAGRRLSRVLHYQSPSTLTFHPTVFVDVTAFITGKLAALKEHASQVELSAMVEPDAVEATARYWGSQARIGYAEPFEPTRMVFDLAPISSMPTRTRTTAAVDGERRARPRTPATVRV
ncbi:PIG-L deacetylase family protein [Klenkia soli]|uniref:PIG-L deacetylase family protein n=1 Tax=Klenkia soli TaxID=1052260 RepID=UPI000AC2578E|nr:PIG-L family deacetylase [Klenkia soli]